MHGSHDGASAPPPPACDRLARYVRTEGPVQRRTYPVRAGTMPAQELETSDGVRWLLIEIVPVATVTDLYAHTHQRLTAAVAAKHERKRAQREKLRRLIADIHAAPREAEGTPDQEAA